ncbi:MAG: FAD-dependent oxidoreductase [Bacteroides xylanisolvens]
MAQPRQGIIHGLMIAYRGKNDERQIQWVYESSVAERIMRDMLKTAGVEILFNHRLDLNKNVRKEENIIRSIQLENGKVIEAKMFIDASYEGDLLARAGVSYTVDESNSTWETYNGIRPITNKEKT